MNVAVLTQIILLGVLSLGLCCAYATTHGWVPARLLLQPDRQTWARVRERLPLSLFNLATLMLVSYLVLSQVQEHFAPTPALAIVVLQIALITIVEDTWFYFMHRAFHEVPYLYRRVHRVHHRAHAPVPMDYLYVHPVELWFGTLGTTVGLGAVLLLWGGLSAVTFLSYSALRALHELHAHSGLRPWILDRVPLVGTVAHHDLHHAKPTLGNYSTALRFWDWLFGTAARG